MSDNATREEAAAEDAPERFPEADESSESTSEPGPHDGQATGPLTELERATRERDEYLAHWQRAQADFQNQKRRTISDIDTAVRRSQGALLEEILLVLDHLDLALTTPCESADAKNLLVGVQMTRDQMIAALQRQGVTSIKASGIFDPAVHQAVATVETAEHEPGHIIDVVRSGWMHNDLVLRFAQVRVAAHTDAEVRDGTDATSTEG